MKQFDEEEVNKNENNALDESPSDDLMSEYEKLKEELGDQIPEEDLEVLKQIMEKIDKRFNKTTRMGKLKNIIVDFFKRTILFLLSLFVAYGLFIGSINSTLLNISIFFAGLSVLQAIIRIIASNFIKTDNGVLTFEAYFIIICVLIVYALTRFNYILSFNNLLNMFLFFIFTVVFNKVLNYYIFKFSVLRMMRG